MKDKLFIFFQYIIPHHLLSRFVGLLAESEIGFVKNFVIKFFIKQFDVDMSQAERQTPEEFKNFNDFFTRSLKEGMRPIVEGDKTIACPADGAVSQLGDIENGRIFQAKGHNYSLTEILGGDTERAKPFMGGKFATVYLSPRDYHRLHMPITGTLREMIYVPGPLFSVNQTTAENVPNLFSRNERVVAIFDTEAGPMALVLVGAMIVAGIGTVWEPHITPPKRQLKTFTYPTKDQPQNAKPLTIQKGEEMGRFFLGSTIVMCFGEDQVEWSEKFEATTPTVMGEHFGDLK